MKSLVLIILLVILPACSNSEQITLTGEQTKRFSAAELVGYKLTLVSKTGIGEYSFMDKGDVVTTIGTVGGPVAGPILQCQIDQQGRLVIDFDDFKEFWRKLSMHGDLIEIEAAAGDKKPYRNRYKISRTGSVSLSGNNYPKTSFTSAELAGVDLQFVDIPDSKYTFNPDGSGTFTVAGVQLNEGERTFRWAVGQKGNLQMTWSSGRVMTWRKLSRTNDIIEAEFTEPPSPPWRATYRRSKQ